MTQKSAARSLALPLGLFIAASIVLSPLDTLGRMWFSAHMAQHLLLILVAAPLISWSGPVHRAATRLERGPTAAWAAAALFAVLLLIWHLPATRSWATESETVHVLEFASVLVAAVSFWRFVIFAGKQGIGRGTSVLIVWLASLQGALLSAIIMFAPSHICTVYAGNPLSDQVLAGLLMCIPASLAYAASSVRALALLFREGEGNAR